MSDPVDRFLAALDGYSGTGPWRARCPAHGGTNPQALSIAEGQDGTVLVRCWRGCSFGEIIDALGLRAHELFPESITSHRHRPNRIRYDRVGIAAAIQCEAYILAFTIADASESRPINERVAEHALARILELSEAIKHA